MSRSPRPRCGGPEIPPRGDRTRVCPVCHGYIGDGQGMGISRLRVMVHRGDCAALVIEVGRVGGQPTGRWHPVSIVRGLVDGARCTVCKAVSK